LSIIAKEDKMANKWKKLFNILFSLTKFVEKQYKSSNWPLKVSSGLQISDYNKAFDLLRGMQAK
jgi:hypothetical protein